MKKIFVFLMILFFWYSSSLAEANVICKAQFVRGLSSPENEIVEFIAAGEKAILEVYNGNMEDTTVERVSSSTLTINGDIILDSSNFNQKVEVIEKVIFLNEGKNTLEAALKGKPGGTITIKIEQENIEASDTVFLTGESGAQVEVIDAESQIIGAKVDIPADPSMPSGEVVEIEIAIAATEKPQSLPTELYEAGENINFISTVNVFNMPVALTIPYNDKNNDSVVDGTAISETRVGVKYFNGSLWEDVPVDSRDMVANTVTIKTTHLSNYIAFVHVVMPAYDETQIVGDNVLVVDGDPSDWEGAGLTPEQIDLNGNLSCNPENDFNYDIKYVYTAIDNTYAYIMIETYGESIPEDAVLAIYVNYKSGENFPLIPYADMGMMNHPDGIDFFQNNVYPIYLNNSVAARGQVLEIKVPLSEIDDELYFNVIRADLSIEESNELCDSFAFGPYMNFNFHNVESLTSDPVSRFNIQFYAKNNNYVELPIDIKSVTLKNIDTDTSITIDKEIVYDPYELILGSWGWFQIKEWKYDPTPYKGSSYNIEWDSLESGNYRLIIVDDSNNKWERDYYYSGIAPITPVYPSASDDNLFFDLEGNLHAYWPTPFTVGRIDQIRFYVYYIDEITDNEEITELFRAVWFSARYNLGHAIITKEALDILYALGKIKTDLSVGFEIRSEDRSNRFSAYPLVGLDEIPVGVPAKWTLPIFENWNTDGFNPDLWGQANGPNGGVIISSNSVIEEAYYHTNANCFTKYKIEGDFDIQVDFNIERWTTGADTSQMRLQLGWGNGEPIIEIGIQPGEGDPYPNRYVSGRQEEDVEKCPPTGWCSDYLVMGTNDYSGTFRMKRVGNSISTFYKNQINGAWVLMQENLEDVVGNEIDDPSPPLILNIHTIAELGVKGTFSNFKSILPVVE